MGADKRLLENKGQQHGETDKQSRNLKVFVKLVFNGVGVADKIKLAVHKQGDENNWKWQQVDVLKKGKGHQYRNSSRWRRHPDEIAFSALVLLLFGKFGEICQAKMHIEEIYNGKNDTHMRQGALKFWKAQIYDNRGGQAKGGKISRRIKAGPEVRVGL